MGKNREAAIDGWLALLLLATAYLAIMTAPIEQAAWLVDLTRILAFPAGFLGAFLAHRAFDNWFGN